MIDTKNAIEAMIWAAKKRYARALVSREKDVEYGYAVSLDELSAVADLALAGGVPDGSFSDAACEAWCIIRRITTR